MEDGSGRGGVSFDKVLVGDAKRMEQVVSTPVDALKYTHRLRRALVARGATRQASCSYLEASDSVSGLRRRSSRSSLSASPSRARLRKGNAPSQPTGRNEDASSGSVGPGMSICKQLVELMGGRIWLHSEPGLGTRVFMQVALQLADGGFTIGRSLPPRRQP